ncbi:MAG: hypothetical protein FJ263_07155 [Planctomycetes bacterium]|nr:hypothetical protein [Planctomycetota bacterium]
MTSANYSKVTEAAANRFLSEYHLTLERLTEPQQKQVVCHLRAKKWWPVTVIVFLAAMIIFGCGVWVKYNQIQEFVGKAVVLSNSGTEIDLQKVSGFSLEQGFNIGVLAVTAVYMILFVIFVPINIRGQKRALDAFLPSITSKPVDGPDKQN